MRLGVFARGSGLKVQGNLNGDLMSCKLKLLLIAFILTGLLIAHPVATLAHKVSVFAWVEGETVYTVSKFSGGKKVKKGQVAVFDPAGHKLLEGLTDDQGEYAFKIPRKTALRVELEAGAGHKGHWIVPLEEITGTGEQSTATDTNQASSVEATIGNQVIADNDTHLEAVIEKVLDRKLKPVMRILAEEKQSGPSLTEILGGIGYIIGLVGIAAYFKSRKKE